MLAPCLIASWANMRVRKGPRAAWESSWRVLEQQNYEKIEVSAAYDDLLGFSPPLHLQKIDPQLVQAASRTASCSIFDPKMVPNWCKRTAVWVHTTSIIPQSLSGSHFPHLFLTIHRFTYHMDFSRALHSMKALLWLVRWRWQKSIDR